MGSHVADYSKATDPKNHFFYQMAAPSRCQVVLVVSSALQKVVPLLERRARQVPVHGDVTGDDDGLISFTLIHDTPPRLIISYLILSFTKLPQWVSSYPGW